MTNEEIIAALAKRNGLKYNLTKAAEELIELAEVLLKKHNKLGGSKEPTDKEVVDEVGDVAIRLAILTLLFGEDKVEARIQEKLDKFGGYIETNKYQHI